MLNKTFSFRTDDQRLFTKQQAYSDNNNNKKTETLLRCQRTGKRNASFSKLNFSERKVGSNFMAIIRGIRNHHRTCLLRSGREHDCRILDGRRTYRQVCQLSRRRSSRAKKQELC
ncbi:hypothetical protein CDAR_196541 [Caerostris darwini]|uniref:Uncharacterized protein n=1 Tax=Caerostris darwini TaxID=1538125 RepID=A0AAV4Q214_9ARAC|nr:hypothetical protein CDAR_196541 [Caerostris darwini]